MSIAVKVLCTKEKEKYDLKDLAQGWNYRKIAAVSINNCSFVAFI